MLIQASGHQPTPRVAAADGEIVSVATFHARRPGWRMHGLAGADWVMAALLCVGALTARWPLIERGETLLHPDEAIVGIMAQDIAAGRALPIYFYGQRYMGAFEAYVIAAVSPFFENQIHALRFAPACFFAAFVVIEYLMLTRWFGRKGGLVGAAVLLAGSPMFAQWCVSARGAYIEILVWGAAILWAYSEWFGSGNPTRRRRFFFGLLIGTGVWLNPSIVLFLAPIILHFILGCSFAAGHRQRLAAVFGRGLLPTIALLAVLMMNCTWATWVENEQIRTLFFLGLVPRSGAAGLMGVAVVAGVGFMGPSRLRAWARKACGVHAPLVFGILVGLAPSFIYAARVGLGLQSMEPALPLGLRPIWTTGETMVYLLRGLPIFFGADARPFMSLVTAGRDHGFVPLDIIMSGWLGAANWLVLGGIVSSAIIFVLAYREEIGSLLRLETGPHSPVILVLVGTVGVLALYILGGCSFSFTTMRYLLPIWVFVPALLAAIFVHRSAGVSGRAAPLILCAAWGLGQVAMFQQLGSPHPLRPVADALVGSGQTTAVAEILDAHLLSYLTKQECRVREFQPFWPRLAKFEPQGRSDESVCYLANTHELDRTSDWTDHGRPGPAPPETQRSLWPAMQRALIREPRLLLSRSAVSDEYELLHLSKPLNLR